MDTFIQLIAPVTRWLTPWGIVRHFIFQTSTLARFTVGGVELPAVPADDWLHAMRIPSTGNPLRRLWLALQIFVPAGLVLRYDRRPSFDVQYTYEKHDYTTGKTTTIVKVLPATQVDNKVALVSYLPRAERLERERVAAAEKRAHKVANKLKKQERAQRDAEYALAHKERVAREEELGRAAAHALAEAHK